MFSFDLDEVEVKNEFSPIVPGFYEVQFESIEESKTLNDEVKWSAKLKIINSGRTFFLNWNVGHSSVKARSFAQSEVKKIADALKLTGKVSIDDLRTNAIFKIQLEQSPYNDKMYYTTKGPWVLVESLNVAGIAKVQASLGIIAPTGVKKKNPWDRA